MPGGLSTSAWLDRHRPHRESVLLWSSVLSMEGALVVGYVLIANVWITNPLILIYPFVWINVGGWAVLQTTPRSASRRRNWSAIVVSIGYFTVLAYFGGLVVPGASRPWEFAIRWGLPPGYSPRVLIVFEPVRIILTPYKVVGYAVLAYLVYTAIIDAVGTALRGLVGVFTCVSCTWPILGTLLASVFGSASIAATIATNQPYGISTGVYLSAVGLLMWRPLR